MFKRLFGGDPAERLQRAEKLLVEGKAVRALEIADKIASRGGELAGRAQGLAQEAREAIVRRSLERAEQAEQDGNLEDAADWLDAAIARVEESGRRQELEARRDSLLRRADEAHEAGFVALPQSEESSFAQDPDEIYEALVEGLVPEWAARFKDRPADFRRNWVALNEGRADEAVEHFDQLAASSPQDPVARLERGRCRLMLGDNAGARSDLELAWEHLGSEPLDLAGHLTVPGLWAEATLEAGEPARVVQRLEPLADPMESPAEIPVLYAQALLATGALDEAKGYLYRAVPMRSNQPSLSYLLAQAELAGGDPAAAVETLEMAVKPSCSTGRCGAPPRHPPSLRLLAALHLEHGMGAERARELMAWVLSDQGGLVTAEDEAILRRLDEG